MSLSTVQKLYPQLVDQLDSSGVRLIQGSVGNAAFYTQLVIPPSVCVRNYSPPGLCFWCASSTPYNQLGDQEPDSTLGISPADLHATVTSPMLCIPISSVGKYPGAFVFSRGLLCAPEDRDVTEAIEGIGFYHDTGWVGRKLPIANGLPCEAESPIFWTSGAPLIVNGVPLTTSKILEGWNAQFGWSTLLNFATTKESTEITRVLSVMAELLTAKDVQCLLDGGSICLNTPRRLLLEDPLRGSLNKDRKLDGIDITNLRKSIRISIDFCTNVLSSLLVLGTKDGSLYAILFEPSSGENLGVTFDRIRDFCHARGLEYASITNCGNGLTPFHKDGEGTTTALSVRQNVTGDLPLQLLGFVL